MNIALSVDSYKGVDGSSLSAARCHQIVKVYEMLHTFGKKSMTYIGIQDEAQKARLFGDTNAKSAIRTFFPLLKKIGFVNYDGTFHSDECFTELGLQFVLACRALENVSDDTPNKKEVIERLENIKQSAQKEGLVKMFLNKNYENHNMWVAIKLLKVFGTINWNAFLYTLHCIEIGYSIEEAIDEIKKKKHEIDSIDFVNEEGEKLPNTCYSYIRSFLEEAGMISKVSSKESMLVNPTDKLFTIITV